MPAGGRCAALDADDVLLFELHALAALQALHLGHTVDDLHAQGARQAAVPGQLQLFLGNMLRMRLEQAACELQAGCAQGSSLLHASDRVHNRSVAAELLLRRAHTSLSAIHVALSHQRCKHALQGSNPFATKRCIVKPTKTGCKVCALST